MPNGHDRRKKMLTLIFFLREKLRIWWDLSKQTLCFAIKETRWTSEHVGYHCFDVIHRYFGARKTEKQLDENCRTCSVGSQTSTKLYNEPALYVWKYPSIPPLAFESKMYPLKLNPVGPRASFLPSSKLCVAFRRGWTKISVQTNHAARANTSALFRGSRYYWRCLGNLENTVDLKPLISSVSSSFHHVFFSRQSLRPF